MIDAYKEEKVALQIGRCAKYLLFWVFVYAPRGNE